MTNQPGVSGNAGVPIAGAAAASGAFDDRDDERQTDDGVPVGQADLEADRARASGDANGDEDEDDLSDMLDDGDSTAADGVPVGSADAEEDRRRAARQARESE